MNQECNRTQNDIAQTCERKYADIPILAMGGTNRDRENLYSAISHEEKQIGRKEAFFCIPGIFIHRFKDTNHSKMSNFDDLSHTFGLYLLQPLIAAK